MTLEGIKACVDAGAGAVIAKSINESQAAQDQLDIADYVFADSVHQALGDRRPSETDSLFNRSGLAQTTLDDWLELLDEAQRYAAARGCTTIDRGEAVADMMSTVRTATDKPIFLKLPSTASDVQALALAGQASGADAVVFAGRYNGFIPDIETFEPLLGSWGAYGGSWALPMSVHSVSKAFCSTELTVPVVGTNGARNAEDVIRFLVSGASAVELVTAVWMQGPRVITTILEGIKAYLAKHGITDTQELVGRSALKSRSYAEIEPLSHRPAPWQHGTD